MTTPSGRISLDDIRNETGATGKVSLNDWFVRQVAKTDSGRISMSSMRGKTCSPGPLNPQYPGSYITSEVYVQGANAAYWSETLSTVEVTKPVAIRESYPGAVGSLGLDSKMFPTVRYYRGTYQFTGGAVGITRYYGLRVVGG